MVSWHTTALTVNTEKKFSLFELFDLITEEMDEDYLEELVYEIVNEWSSTRQDALKMKIEEWLEE